MSSGGQTSLESAICGEEFSICLCSHPQRFIMLLSEGEAFNITFGQAVETYNCLYYTTSPDYSSKDEQDKAWYHMAQKSYFCSCLATTKALRTSTFSFRYGCIQHLLLLRLFRVTTALMRTTMSASLSDDVIWTRITCYFGVKVPCLVSFATCHVQYATLV